MGGGDKRGERGEISGKGTRKMKVGKVMGGREERCQGEMTRKEDGGRREREQGRRRKGRSSGRKVMEDKVVWKNGNDKTTGRDGATIAEK